MGWMANKDASMKKLAMMMVAMVGVGSTAWAQTPTPPVMSPATAEAAQVPGAPTAAPQPKAPANPFPPVNLKNFTADSPTTAEVNAFLRAVWGYDQSRIWSVAAIQKTQAPGVARVVVFAADKTQADKVSRNEFFITPDGKHAIAGGVIDFGEKPFAERRELLQQEANGPAEGAAGKELLLVEFSDLLNARSKEAADIVGNLVKEIPQARLVIESVPADGSVYSFRAAADGVCVRKAKGDAAYFAYEQAVYAKQKGLTATTLQPALDDAVTSAGADAKSVATCAVSPETKAEIQASIALATKAGVDVAPALVVNGRVLPPEAVPYDMLKRVVAYQAQLDGVHVTIQPTLTNLK